MIGAWWHFWLLPAIGTSAILFNLLFLRPWFKRTTAHGATFIQYCTIFISLGLAWLVWLIKYQQTLT
ncbi:hypothetical protein C4546_02920 [Candidatus Parcubacteria bacterium]|nr:MAG: hypothetical protein C4546_02920 [Candidatus Parcubacteria bacterium]